MINFFHYRNRITPGRDQMSSGHLVRDEPACGVLKIYLEPMINFFRRIRKQLADDNPPSWPAGKPLKYMRYAIGEILFVVIGILIALSINNWNEENKESLS